MVLKHHDMLRAVIANVFQFGAEPSFLPTKVVGGLVRRMDDDRIEDHADESTMSERIKVPPEQVGIGRDGVCRWDIFNVVISDNVVDRDLWIDLRGDALELRNLGRISGLVHEIA